MQEPCVRGGALTSFPGGPENPGRPCWPGSPCRKTVFRSVWGGPVKLLTLEKPDEP